MGNWGYVTTAVGGVVLGTYTWIRGPLWMILVLPVWDDKS